MRTALLFSSWIAFAPVLILYPVQAVAATQSGVTWNKPLVSNWAYDGARIAGRIGNDAYVWSAKSGKLIHKFVGHAEIIQGEHLSSDGRLLLTSSWLEPAELPTPAKDISVRIWDIHGGKQIDCFRGQLKGEFSPNGKLALTFDAHKTQGLMDSYLDAAVWDVNSGNRLVTCKLSGATPKYSQLHFTADGNDFVYLGDGGVMRLFDAHSGALIGQTEPAIQGVSFHLDSTNTILEVLGYKHLQYWNFRTRKLVHDVPIASSIPPKALSSDGEMVAYLNDDHEIEFMRQSGKTIQGARFDSSIVRVVFSPDSSKCCVKFGQRDGGYPHFISIVDTKSAKELARVKLPPRSVLIGYSPDGRTILCGGPTFTIYDASTLNPLRSLRLEGWHPPPSTPIYDLWIGNGD